MSEMTYKESIVNWLETPINLKVVDWELGINKIP